MVRTAICAVAIFGFMASATAQQLPPEAVQLDKVKIADKVGTEGFDPVTGLAADPSLGTVSHGGVTYGLSAKESKAAFEADPEKYAKDADKNRWILNFMQQMSPIWCPVTDEIGPGNMLQWKEEGYTWESCCTFCDQTVQPENFPAAVKRLKKRADQAYALQKGAYSEGASSPVEGAIDLNAGLAPIEGNDPEFEPAWLADAELEATYSGGVAEIIEYRCLECHRMGGAAPMPLQSYADVRKWSDKLKDIITLGTMPPWPADAGVGTFSNSKRLTEREKNIFLEWIDAKFPRGEGQYALKGVWAGEGYIGEPDATIELEEYEIPGDITEEIHEVELDFGNADGEWIVAAQAQPSDWFLVHNIDAGPVGHFFPGNGHVVLPEGYGRKLAAGQKINAKFHYVKEEGWEEYDASTFAVRFAEDDADLTEVKTERMENNDFVLPAGEGEIEVQTSTTFEADRTILGLTPVMHVRGKSAAFTVTTPDGTETKVLSISKWDPKWQFTYWLAEPIEAPKGTVVTLTGVFDNSEMNALNPDPTAEIKAGLNGEVLQGWIEFSEE